MDEDLRLLERRVERERAARKQAEHFIEERSRALYLKDQELERKNQELTLAEAELRRERDFVAGVIDAAQAVVLVIDGDGRILRANAFAATVAGLTASELVGRDPLDAFFAPEARTAARALLQLARSQPSGDAGTMPLVTAAGEPREFAWFHSRLPGAGAEGSLVLLVGRDMTERERLFREVQRLSTTDPLTGLSNRRHFGAAAQLEVLRARRYGRPLAAVMVDLDHFKRVNDTHGHAAGDRVLVEVSGICLGLARKTDLKARLGGEEFCLLLPETTAESARVLAERLRTDIESLPFDAEGRPFRVTASVGIAGYAPGEELEELLGRADRALYEAKESGRNRVVLALTEPGAGPAPAPRR
jgi:diguanylate cyclase (GGDEF)-like protein/PAS domain S-box-containing protein